MKRIAPAWLMPVVVIFTLQTLASFLSRLIPIIAPAMSEEFGWSGSSIGYLTASSSLGALVILVAGASFIRQTGATRTLQLVLILGALCMGLFLYPSLSLALAACFIIGTSVGAANPAGSKVLQRFSPPEMRNLIFSIKQAGVPVGGMVAGLFAPVVILLAGWRLALLACAVVVILPTLLTWKTSANLDEKHTASKPKPSGIPARQALRSLSVPLASLTHNRGLFKMAMVGSLFAVAQSSWFAFTVVYLVDELHYSLSLAGIVFAVMQVGGVLGRVILGWLSDRLGSTTAILSIAAIFSAATTALLGLTSPSWPLWSIILLAFIAGSTAASWNGIQIAELARRSPPHLVAETASGSAVLINLINIIVPVTFAMSVTLLERYDVAFICAGACSLLVLVYLPRDRHDAVKPHG